jgi:hypothetical protein
MVLGCQFASAQPREWLELQDLEGQLDFRLLGNGVSFVFMRLYEYRGCSIVIGAQVYVPCILGAG